MKNPLTKRIPRELKQDFFKYFVIFAFMVMLIGLVSGFVVADDGFEYIYNHGFKEQKIEDGHLSFNSELEDSVIEKLESKGNLSLYKYFYFEEDLKDTDKTIRVYSTDREVNLLSILSGKLPEKQDEIALDRMFADNNKIKVGNTITLKDLTLTVTGLIASPDYSCLFEKNSDMMFDSLNFSIAVMTPEGIENFASNHTTYNYAWLYPEKIERTDKGTAKKRSEEFISVLEEVLTEEASKAMQSAATAEIPAIDDSIDAAGTAETPAIDDSAIDAVGTAETPAIDDSAIDAAGTAETPAIDDSIIDAADTDEMSSDTTNYDLDLSSIDTSDNTFSEFTTPLTLTDYLPRYLNQAINFTGDDMSGDRVSILLIDYIITLVLAFVFAITISGTISAESGVIGTLRASGYTKAEIIRHYMVLPVVTSLCAAIIGNILGYTVCNQLFVDVYYGSYSFPKYVHRFSSSAFILTTLIPLVIMVIINLLTLIRKLKLSPLRFLRHDLGRKGKKKSFRLNTKIPFIHRFRMRIIFQNIPNYLTLFCGIFIGGVLMVFGMMFGPMLNDYKNLIIEDRICDYQYVLSAPVETGNSDAEKYNLTSLKTTSKDYVEDEISVFGIQDNSKYIKADVKNDEISISSSIAAKFKLKSGDSLKLKDPYNEKKTYTFDVDNIYDYNSGLAIFMSQSAYQEYFNTKADEFTGYFSNEKLTDIDEKYIMTMITVNDLTKTSNQLTLSMGEMMSIFNVVGIIIFMLLMFILSKQIIEKNAKSISMCKILGFSDIEIGKLYIVATSVVVVLSLLVTIPLVDVALRIIFSSYIYTAMSGYIPYMVSPDCYVKMFAAGLICYVIIAVVQLAKINHIPKSDALKNME